jgi:hypothetical protein
MTDRDTFAAAALPGLLVNGPFNTDAVPRLAYSMADAMIRERGNHSETPNSSPTLTDEEREAIELALSKRLDLDAIYTLRNLLERLK